MHPADDISINMADVSQPYVLDGASRWRIKIYIVVQIAVVLHILRVFLSCLSVPPLFLLITFLGVSRLPSFFSLVSSLRYLAIGFSFMIPVPLRTYPLIKRKLHK